MYGGVGHKYPLYWSYRGQNGSFLYMKGWGTFGKEMQNIINDLPLGVLSKKMKITMFGDRGDGYIMKETEKSGYIENDLHEKIMIIYGRSIKDNPPIECSELYKKSLFRKWNPGDKNDFITCLKSKCPENEKKSNHVFAETTYECQYIKENYPQLLEIPPPAPPPQRKPALQPTRTGRSDYQDFMANQEANRRGFF